MRSPFLFGCGQSPPLIFNFQLSIFNSYMQNIQNNYKIFGNKIITKYVTIIMKYFIKRRFFCEKDKKIH